MHIAWTASIGATHYVVQRSSDGGDSWTNASMSLSSGATSFDDSSLTELTPYQYQVIASNTGGNSAASSPAAAVVTLPTAPSELETTSITSTEVDLSWTDNSNGDAAFDVQRSDINGLTWTTIGSTDTGATTFQDTTAAAGTVYQYQVLADNGSVISAPSSALEVLTLAAAPTVTATPAGAGEVDLSWNAPQSATTYTIYRKVNAGMYGQLATDVTATAYADTTTSGGTHYTYEVFAVNATGSSTAGTSSTALTVPAAQTDFAATAHSATEIDLNWTDVTGATSYTIERKTGSDDFSVLTSALTSGDNSYDDTTALPATSYTYEIVGIDATGDSAATQSSALTVPASVTIASTTIVSTSEIDLAWDADAGTVGGYRVLRSTGGGFSQDGPDLASTVTSFQDTGLDAASATMSIALSRSTRREQVPTATQARSPRLPRRRPTSRFRITPTRRSISPGMRWTARPATRSTGRTSIAPGRRLPPASIPPPPLSPTRGSTAARATRIELKPSMPAALPCRPIRHRR